ncbi:MAG: GFA family protein [Steroidobacteraceae bacterium]
MTGNLHRGSCLCGDTSYEVRGPLRNVVACHCTQCRKQTGHFMAATSVDLGSLRLVRADQLRWYRSSASAERGFCGRCGSILFWKTDGRDEISITAGSIDGPTGLVIEGHIFCADKGDYYAIPDEGYRFEQWA